MKKRVVITDTNMERRAPSGPCIAIPPGEGSKTREMKAWIEDQMIQEGFGRDSEIIAFGGGVILDIAGFVAATFCRGIPWVAIPTTLLAMVDASIGGKVAVNTPLGKNLVGAFHPPQEVKIDLSYLDTLPKLEWKNGIAEIIKYGLIQEPSLLENPGSPTSIERAIEIKKRVVKQDPLEMGIRRTLNFGHTIGHALEQLSGYSLSHGEAISIGMRVAAHLSPLSTAEVTRIEECLTNQGFAKKSIPKDVIEVIKRDKKAIEGKPRFVLLETIGKTLSFGGDYCKEITEEELLCALEKAG